ncbi:myocyte-specific enhancer factor 2C-like isoform X1 [Rhopilema esculentum]|uniref:myocyte-specific enhancer factor 2C-like isoform X1 n=2 Tax=Rhopilema esculentum TaxID=499914 RepID=UPI0031D080EF
MYVLFLVYIALFDFAPKGQVEVGNFRSLLFYSSALVYFVHSFKLASEVGKDKPLAPRVVPQSLSIDNQRMGRKKIQISKINDERNRQVTFTKRKFGLMKKAYELSILCDCEIALIIFNSGNKLFQYASSDMDKILLRYTEYNEPHESRTNADIIEAISRKENKQCNSPEEAEGAASFVLTPRTELKFNKINEEFDQMMKNNQLRDNHSQWAHNAPNSYKVSTHPYHHQTMPVSVPVSETSPNEVPSPPLRRPQHPTMSTQAKDRRHSSSPMQLIGSQPRGMTSPSPRHQQDSRSPRDFAGGGMPPSTSPAVISNQGKTHPGLKVVIPSSSSRQPHSNMQDGHAPNMSTPLVHMNIPTNDTLATPVISLATPSMPPSMPSSFPSGLPSGYPGDYTLESADAMKLMQLSSLNQAYSSQQQHALQRGGMGMPPGKSVNVKVEPSDFHREMTSPVRAHSVSPRPHLYMRQKDDHILEKTMQGPNLKRPRMEGNQEIW